MGFHIGLLWRKNSSPIEYPDVETKADSPSDHSPSNEKDDTQDLTSSHKSKPSGWPAFLRAPNAPPIPKERQKHASHSRWPLSRPLFSWASYLVWTSIFRQLHINDIEQLDEKLLADRRINFLRDRLHYYASKKSKYPLLRAIFHCYRSIILLSFASVLTHVYGGIYYVLLFRTFAEYLKGCHDTRNDEIRGGSSFGHGLAIVIGASILYFLIMLFKVHALYNLEVVGGQVRTLLGSMMFEKSFVISPSARRKHKAAAAEQQENPDDDLWTRGAVLSSLTTDTERIQDMIAASPNIIGFPSGLPGLLGVGWILMNWPGFAAGCFFIVTTPPLLQVLRVLAQKRASINTLTDKRVGMVSDMLQGIRFLKIFAWEDIFLARLGAVRQEEIRKSMRLQLVTVSSWIAIFTQQRFAALLAIGLYTLYGSANNTLAIIPYALVLWFIVILSEQMGLAAPVIANSIPAVHNVEEFLLAEEQTPGSTFNRDIGSELAFDLKEASFKWIASGSELRSDQSYHKKDEFNLKPLTLSIGGAELVVVVGPVGCGKSSIAAALTGEMSHVGGTVAMRDSVIAYHSQSPWIQNSTVQDNIIFGKPYDRDRYKRIVSACALDRDINEEFPAGDRTELGERGITISGGQKARIQLARTLYRGLKTVILDDPLSAVDAHTSTQIFENVIAGDELRDCCRILITHQLHILSRCDRVIWMEDGLIRAVDTYKNLLRDEPDFVNFVDDATKHVEEEETAEDDTPEPSTPTNDQIDHSVLRSSNTLSPVAKAQKQFKGKEEDDQLMAEEVRAIKSIPLSLYWSYFGHAPRWTLSVLICFLLASQAINVMFELQIAYWTSDKWGIGDLGNAMILLGVILGHVVTWGPYFVGINDYFIAASHGLSKDAMAAVLHSPMVFFDTTPLGRIINRFTLDINYMDTSLSYSAWWVSLCSTAIASLMVVVIYYVPISAAVFVPWLLGAWLILYLYRSTPLEVKRLEVLRTSIYVAKLSEGINGRQTITSCGRQADFSSALREIVDELNSIHFMSYATSAWMTVRQDFLTCILFVIVGILVLAKRYDVEPSVALFLVYFCTGITEYLQNILNAASDFQRGMNAVERLQEYSQLSPEGIRHCENFAETHKDWPTKGDIVIKGAAMRYRPGLPLVLNNMNLSINSGEKVGIVGRTGAGKSSILAVLLRTVELAEGTITVDGVDIRSIGLHDLRRQISVIPQDPTLFEGTLRFNLNPEGTVPDATLLEALRDVSLISDTDVSRQRLTLDSPIRSEGINFSSGDRQLIALARALVRDNKIVIIDEATSNVDPRTDNAIQKTIREHKSMRDKTIIAIAHRIKTLVGYDKICVMEKGQVIEYGTPRDLWTNAGIFRTLCERSHLSEEAFG